MIVIAKLSSSTGKRNKTANKAFAKEIAEKNDVQSIKELVGLVDHKDRNIQSDAIEVLYETGYLKPELIAVYYKIFVELLSSKNNRLVWGAMIALGAISRISPEVIFSMLPEIRTAVDKGSVITKDAGVLVYANLATDKDRKDEVLALLFSELKKCPDKQLAQYAEKSIIAIDKDSQKVFLGIINSRMKNLEKASQIKRLKNVIKKVEQI